MHRRIERRLERAGLPAAHARVVLDANAAALAHRMDVLGDDEHPDLLHPSRTLLILLDDCGVVDARVLEAAASVESEHPALRIPHRNDLAGSVPLADSETLLEDLVSVSDDVRSIALAERLDHARHLHLREHGSWPSFHEQACSVYRPVAHRSLPRLARRYDWWCRMFARRFLGSGSA